MLLREQIVAEIEKRMTTVSGVNFVARNPVKEPGDDDFPVVMIFEMPDSVEEISFRGQKPSFKRRLQVLIEVFVSGSTVEKGSRELMAFFEEVKRTLYAEPLHLGGLASITEDESGRVVRPSAGGKVIGLGTVFSFRYVEDINAL